MPVLRLVREKAEATDFPLLTTEISIGRHQANAVVLEGEDISRKHARITRKDEDYILTDLDSHNGTLVNGQIVRSVKLKSGDEIRIGKYRLVFVAEAGPETRPPLPASPPTSEVTQETLHETITSRGGLLAFFRKIALF